ncbi:ATPase [Halosegnis sp.]|uniref:ATPase n=1 Tax=Halosegnis sp. TaxID=2864959 RepID=UPI0035D3EABD
MRLLVAGSDRVDAGKTTFSAGLCRERSARGYKPRAGNDYWFDHDDYRRAVADGRLYGKDAKRLAAASPGEVAPEEINPVHRLWLPTPGRGAGLLGRDGRQFVCDRVWTGDDTEFVRNDTVEVPASVSESLPLADAHAVESLPAFNDLMAQLHAPATERVIAEATARDRAVIESYADIARPHPDIVADAVAVVEPRRCRVFDGDRYLKACEVASGSAREGRLEERVDNVLELVEPAATVELPALSQAEQEDPDAIATAYAPAYERLTTVAAQ